MENLYFFKTLGCQMNELDSFYIRTLLNQSFSETKLIEKANIIIFNTCSIRESSENKLLNLLSWSKNIKLSKKKKYL